MKVIKKVISRVLTREKWKFHLKFKTWMLMRRINIFEVINFFDVWKKLWNWRKILIFFSIQASRFYYFNYSKFNYHKKFRFLFLNNFLQVLKTEETNFPCSYASQPSLQSYTKIQFSRLHLNFCFFPSYFKSSFPSFYICCRRQQ